ncbi:uncharacterized protein LOC131310804 [Rhododendron vialii]|uniref:uncharacterized protein LOC131310804 n=1 Tax=Rhododendron vialii TaxID=182163 RepID=UPI00265D6422|nr:uncharacterized protein LOC131310804 [Rhododendron vialii]XP_058193997.1 uncharacterized protein LOC131310804 [Rhododendron vialii]
MIVNCNGMIVNCNGIAAVFTTWRRKPPTRILCFSSHTNTEQLRAQLDQLHSEAQQARTKANNARLRLMRLSEAAEKLQRQAAIMVQTGRENDAWELLFQKKKVMQALDKSKARITLFDELSSKLNEVISVKETQLIQNIASDVDIGIKDASSTVRIVSPKDEDTRNQNKDDDLELKAMKYGADQLLQVDTEGQADQQILDSVDNQDFRNEADIIYSLKGISSYEDFIEHLDQQLNKIETELVMVLGVSTLLLEKNEKPKNSKVRQTEELLEGVRTIRERLSSIMQRDVRMR